ncbi:MAG TPA: hypothetical protein VFT09_04595, partial [Ilumatobacteraceae bacterium]|nr:hypothetical protein [Ilumatobacteraceae bacterium]
MSTRTSRRRMGIVTLAVAALTMASACGDDDDDDAGGGGDGDYVVGVSNTLAGNGWREEMICAVKA